MHGSPGRQFYNPLGPNAAYYTKLSTVYKVTANDPPLPGESSALLLMALEKGAGGQGTTTDLFGAAYVRKVTFPATPAPIDVPVFKDDWGTPFQFYRWTTANPDVDALAPTTTSKLRNPLDPTGKLTDPTWYNGASTQASRILFENSCYSLTNGGGPYAFYIKPVLASAGVDLKLGLDLQTMATTNTADASDNLYNYSR